MPDPERMRGQERKRLRLPAYDYSQVGGYFVTVCSRRRACLFGTVVDGQVRLNDLGALVAARWRAIPDHYPEAGVDAFVSCPITCTGSLSCPRRGTGMPVPYMW
jgi:hypothetical protein